MTARNTDQLIRNKPLKRPSQARAKFTVQAIYDAFVRIWRDKGWAGITTRAVALETGISVGTLYDYFPNKHSLLSGYVRHCIDTLLEQIDAQAIVPADLVWQERIHRLIRLTCGVNTPELPYFDRDMMMLESQIAETKHHRRAYEEISVKWMQVFDVCADVPRKPDVTMVKSLFLSVWGGRRYLLLVEPDDINAAQWVLEMERQCFQIANNVEP
ncbi:TetR/AcrR family transcriptional regulator [Undibacterium sp. Jales W-56]|uniref:TetR/AcrR family transcriptional regulator n=1 Tax=Undibacterium sp. Jales W-56 TaxID=2897325 RepID=UPI0021CE1461|nr:TetR/AcrR family transcriptional regulator [Undibacterium sp. Jales W-56]MCU6433790.1 TetR/AcrR family transcriptional regulator [Undibacterium sp. Jales W-56]